MPPRKQSAAKGKGVAPNATSKLFPDAPPLPKLTDKNKIVKNKGSRSTLGDHSDGQAQVQASRDGLLLEEGMRKGRTEATLAFLEKTVKELDDPRVPVGDLLAHLRVRPEEDDILTSRNEQLLAGVNEALATFQSSSSSADLSATTLRDSAICRERVLAKMEELGAVVLDDTIKQYRIQVEKLTQENESLKQQLASTNEYLAKSLGGSRQEQKTNQEDPEFVQNFIKEIQREQAELRTQLASAKDQVADTKAQHRQDQDKIQALELAAKKREMDIAGLGSNARDREMVKLQGQQGANDERIADREAYITRLEEEIATLKEEKKRELGEHHE